MEDKSLRVFYKSIRIGLLIVLIDIIIDSTFFLEPTGVIGALFLDVPLGSLLSRAIIISSFIGFGHFLYLSNMKLVEAESNIKKAFREGALAVSQEIRNNVININQSLILLKEMPEERERYLEIIERNNRIIYDYIEGKIESLSGEEEG